MKQIVFTLVLLACAAIARAEDDDWAHWQSQRKGANCFNASLDRTWFADARAAGIPLVRLAWSKWKGAGRDFLLGDADHFAGIPPADRQRIFGEFERLESGDDVGVGLGLAIVERTARLLDVPLTLTSVVGRGSRFAVTLPRTTAVPAPISAPTPPGIARPATILVVDDDRRVGDAMAAMLAARGHRAIPVRDAPAALAVDGALDAAVTIRNSGEDTVEVVQLYAAYPTAHVVRPAAQLLGYARVRIAAGQSLTVHFHVEAARLAATGDARRAAESYLTGNPVAFEGS